MTVKESLRKIRKAHGVTQQEVAAILGIDRTAYTLYETTETKPNIENIFKLSDMYNVTVGYLLGKEKSNHSERLVGDSDVVEEGALDPVALLCKQEKKLILAYRTLSDEDKKKIEEAIKEILNKN